MVQLKARFTFTLSPSAPYDFDLTVRKPVGWPLFTRSEVHEPGLLWTAVHSGGRFLGLRIQSEGCVDRPRLRVDAFTTEDMPRVEKTMTERRLASKLAVHQDLPRFYAAATGDAILESTVGDLYGMRDTVADDLFSAALFAICLQQTRIERSYSMMDNMILRYGDEAGFDGRLVHAWPTPETISKHGVEEVAAECNLGYRAERIVQLARQLTAERRKAGGYLSLERLARLPGARAKAWLLGLPGVGDYYSADWIRPHSGFPIDAWTVRVFGALFFGSEPEGGSCDVARVKAEGVRRWGRWAWLAFLQVVNDPPRLSTRFLTPLRPP